MQRTRLLRFSRGFFQVSCAAPGVLALGLALTACGDPCAYPDVRDRLAAASAGSTVELGACTVVAEEPLVVPPGVHLRGHESGTRIEGRVVLLGSEGATTQLSRVAVTGGAGGDVVRVWSEAGGGEVSITDVHVTARVGIAVAVDEVESLTMSGVTLVGGIAGEEDATLATQPTVPGGREFADYGLVALGSRITLSELDVRGFRVAGACLAVGTTGTWRGGAAGNGIGAGVQVAVDADVSLEDVEISELWLAPAVTSIGVHVDGARVRAAGMTEAMPLVGDAWGVVVANGAEASLENVLIDSNARLGGVAVVDGGALVMQGGSIVGTTQFGVFAYGAASLSLTGTEIRDVVRHAATWSATTEVGDGIFSGRGEGDAPTAISLSGVTLSGNSRIGALFDGNGMDPASLALSDVEVSVPEAIADARGVHLQNVAALPPDWDSDVRRDAITQARDLSGSALEIVEAPSTPYGVIMPPTLVAAE